MSHSHDRSHWIYRATTLGPVACFWMTLAAGNLWVQLAPNQTHGFGNERLVTFTYLQISIVLTSQPLIWISTVN
jgi:hypothetical protein